MEPMCCPSILSAVETTGRLDVMDLVSVCIRRHDLHGLLLACHSVVFPDVPCERGVRIDAGHAHAHADGSGQLGDSARLQGDVALPDELASARGARRDRQCHAWDEKNESSRRRRDRLQFMKKNPMARGCDLTL